ncbi:MAG: hypothetical protein EOP54_23835 [Sphingobacteriales bacterium]|nr:MAG: hypothetical protein EOP54_23835 [Sphingobacteriales bacterium]
MLNLPVPAQMDGRVVYELLKEKTPASAPQKAKIENIETTVKTASGNYKLVLQRTVLGKYIYTDFTKTERVKK